MLNSELLYKNTLYRNIELSMQEYQSAYLGGDAFKRHVRRKRPSEDLVLYNDLISNTAAMPIARYVVDTMNDVVFEPGVNREVKFVSPQGQSISPDSASWAELFQLDATLDNTSLSGIMEQIGDLTSIFGHCWVFVDMPETDNPLQVRPYVIPVPPTHVWDWDFETVRGRSVPEYVKVMEREESDCYYFKVYYLGTTQTPSYWQSWEVDKSADPQAPATLIAQGLFPAGMGIPAFIAYTRIDPRNSEIGISDIDSATEVQREHYKLECEVYQAAQFARTLIRADNGIKVPAHAGAIVRGPQGSVEAIRVDTQDIDQLTKKQQQILDSFTAMAGFAGLTQNRQQVQSGLSIIQERRGLHRKAAAKARLLEIAEECIWTFAARFMECRWAGEVAYNTDYEQHDTQYRIALMDKAHQLLPENSLINGLILRELITMMVAPHEVAEYLEAIQSQQDPTIQLLEQEEQNEVYTRDTDDLLPEPEAEEDAEGESAADSGAIRYTGASKTTEMAVTSAIVGQAGSAGR